MVFRINVLRRLQEGFAVLAVPLFGGEIPGQTGDDGSGAPGADEPVGDVDVGGKVFGGGVLLKDGTDGDVETPGQAGGGRTGCSYTSPVPYPEWDRTRNQVYYRLRGATVVQKDKTKIASDYKSITCVFQLWPLADLNC